MIHCRRIFFVNLKVYETSAGYAHLLPEPPESYFPKQWDRHLIESLPVDEVSVCQLARLPLLHRDPFDRLLICQAIRYDLEIVTVDSAIKAYSVSIAGAGDHD
jgi:PIN domain nuclease of toxin-antitoxin system